YLTTSLSTGTYAYFHSVYSRILSFNSFFFFSSRRRHTRWPRDWSSDVCSSDLTFGLIAWSGFRETYVPYHRPRRLVGSSSWTVRRMLKAAIDTFVSFSFLPIRTISFLGLLVSFLSFVFGFYLVINKLFFGTRVEGWTSVMLAVLVLGGVQLLMIGVLGEYLWRILDEARARPLYIVERTLGFSPAPSPRQDVAAPSAGVSR